MGSRPKDDLRVTPPPRLDRPRRDSRPVTDVDVDKLQTTLDKVVSAVNRSAAHTERIPGIERRVEQTGKDIVKLETKLDGVTKRVTRIEGRVDRGHDCFQVDAIAELKDSQREASQKIEKDVQKGIQQAEQLASLAKESAGHNVDIEDMKKTPRRMFFGLIGIIVTILTGAGGAVWFLAELSRDVEHERELRVNSIKRIETQISTIATKADTAPVKQAIEDLADEVEESNGHAEEFNRLCEGMPSHERRYMKTTLLRRGKRVPQSCLR